MERDDLLVAESLERERERDLDRLVFLRERDRERELWERAKLIVWRQGTANRYTTQHSNKQALFYTNTATRTYRERLRDRDREEE